MLAEFKVENYRSFRDEKILSFVSSADKSFIEENTFPVNGKARLNRTSVLYGANASGKTNIFNALRFFIQFSCLSGPRMQVGDRIDTSPFILDQDTQDKPSAFELTFFIKNNEGRNIRYRYGFTVSREKVFQEYLYAVNNKREVELFFREGQKIEFSQSLFKEGSRLVLESVRENASFLSLCAQANGVIAGSIVSYLRSIRVLSGHDDLHSFAFSENPGKEKKDRIISFLHYADLQIEDFRKVANYMDFSSSSDSLLREYYNEMYPEKPRPELQYAHAVYKDNKKVGIQYISEKDESAGTNRLFDYAYFILDVLDSGGMLFIDEFDSSLHPLIVENIIRLFNSSVENPNNAQLFTSCHSTSIMTNRIFRRDQIWFCEKDRYGASDLYSLADFDEHVRKDASYNKNYLQGKYGAVPSVNESRLHME